MGLALLAICAGMGRADAARARDAGAAAASVARKVYRVGLISYTPAAADMARLKRAMEHLGYFEGGNVVYLQRDGTRNGDPNSGAKQVLDRDVADMVAWRPDAIVSFITTSSTAILHNPAAAHIPVVMFGAEPVESRLALSRRHPGLQFTGFSSRHIDDVLLMRFLKSTIPNLRHVGLMYNGSYSNAPADIVEMNEAGGLMGVKVSVYQVPRHEDFEASIAKMKADGMQAFKVAPHELFSVNGVEIGKLSLKYRLPAVGGYTVLRGGAIASVGGVRDFTEMAPLLDRVLHGADPATTPFQRGAGPQNLIINTDALHQLGLTVPAALLEEVNTQADVAGQPAPTQGAPPPGAPVAARAASPVAEPGPPMIGFARGTPMRVFRIAMIAGESDRGMDELRAMLELAGLKEGVNVVYMRAVAAGHDLSDAVHRVEAFKPDLVLQMDTPAGVALKADPGTAGLKIVGFSGFAVGAGQAQSYKHPGLNFSGASSSPYTATFVLRLLQDTIPGLRVVGDIIKPDDPTAREELAQFEAAADLAGITVKTYPAAGGGVSDVLVRQMKADGVQAVNVALHGPGVHGDQVGQLMQKYRLPAVGAVSVTRGGGIGSIGGGFAWRALRGTIVNVLNGAQPGDIAINRDAWPVITLNTRAAKALGLRIPDHLIDDADEVIE